MKNILMLAILVVAGCSYLPHRQAVTNADGVEVGKMWVMGPTPDRNPPPPPPTLHLYVNGDAPEASAPATASAKKAKSGTTSGTRPLKSRAASAPTDGRVYIHRDGDTITVRARERFTHASCYGVPGKKDGPEVVPIVNGSFSVASAKEQGFICFNLIAANTENGPNIVVDKYGTHWLLIAPESVDENAPGYTIVYDGGLEPRVFEKDEHGRPCAPRYCMALAEFFND